VLPLPPATRQGLLQAMRQALAQIEARPALLQQPQALAQLRDALAQRWLEALPQQVDLRPLKSVAARRRVVERARALVLAQPDRLVDAELCRQLGASPRKLSYCFNECGPEPGALRLLRLLGVHRALRQAGTAHSSVQALAADGASGTWASSPATTGASSVNCLREHCAGPARPRPEPGRRHTGAAHAPARAGTALVPDSDSAGRARAAIGTRLGRLAYPQAPPLSAPEIR
jgi:AraC-like DNA-binding protein